MRTQEDGIQDDDDGDDSEEEGAAGAAAQAELGDDDFWGVGADYVFHDAVSLGAHCLQVAKGRGASAPGLRTAAGIVGRGPCDG